MRTLVAVLAFMLVCSTARSADLDAIEADVESKWNSFKSMTYDMDMLMEMSNPNFSMKNTGTGSAEMKRKSDTVWLMRSDMKSNSVTNVNGKEMKNDSTMMSIMDGDYVYTLSDTNGVKQAMKMKQPKNQVVGGKSFFKYLREDHDVKVLPDETVEGMSCYALEATPKNKQPNQGSLKYCFSKEHGMAVKVVTNDDKGKPLSTMTMKNVKTNPSIADDRFVFTPPAGVEVKDMDNLGKQSAGANTAAPAKTEPAKTETAETKEDKPEKKETAEKKDDPKKEDTKKEEPKKKRKIPGF